VAVDVGDGKADGIDDERELALPVGERGLGVLERLHVDQHHQRADDHAAFVAQRKVVGLHPAPRAGAFEAAAVEDRLLSGQGPLQMLAAIVARHAAEYFVGRAAQALRPRLARRRLVRGIHIAITRLRVEHARGQAEHLQPRCQSKYPRNEVGAVGSFHPGHDALSVAGAVHCQSVCRQIPTV
jgi:hypothetical protein